MSKQLRLDRWCRVVTLGLAIISAFPAFAANTADVGRSVQVWMTRPAEDVELFQELMTLPTADAVLERMTGLPEDEQFASVVALLQFLPPDQHLPLIEGVRQRVDASENAAAKTRMSLLLAEQMSATPDEALRHLETAVRSAASIQDFEGMTYALLRKAYLQMATRDPAGAATTFAVAAELSERRGELDMQVGALILQANQLASIKQLSKAREVVRKAKGLAKDRQRDDLLGSVRLTEGQIALADGDYDDALRHFAAARGLLEKLPPPGDPQALMTVYQQTGATYRAKEDHGAAIRSWERMMFFATQLGQMEMVAHALRGMGIAHLADGRIESAMTLANLAVNQLEMTQPPTPTQLQELALTYELLAACFRQQGQTEYAVQLLQRARAYHEGLGATQAVALLDSQIRDLMPEEPQPADEEAQEATDGATP